MKTVRTMGLLGATLLLGALAMPAFGQAAPDGNAQPNPPQGGPGGGGPGGGPAQWRQRMEERLKEQLGATDDEFNALKPKIEKLMQLRRDAGGGFGFGRRGPGGPGGGGDANTADLSPVQQASRDLRSTLDNKDSKPEDIKAKLDALRAAKTKAQEDLTAAQKDLQSVLTQRQEAVLVMDGILN